MEDISDSFGNFVSNPLVNAQILLADSVGGAPFGTLNIPHEIQQWARGMLALDNMVRHLNFTYLRQGDSMMHVNKGVIGLRIDGCRSVHLQNVTVTDIQNFGDGGKHRPMPGEDGLIFYQGAEDGGHPAQGRQRGYMGADVRGISISGSLNVSIDNTTVQKIGCENGWAIGVDAFNTAHRITLVNSTIDQIVSRKVSEFGFRATRAIGLRVTETAEGVDYHNLNIKNIECPTIGSTADVLSSDEEPHTHFDMVRNVFEL